MFWQSRRALDNFSVRKFTVCLSDSPFVSFPFSKKFVANLAQGCQIFIGPKMPKLEKCTKG
jgi:hypothetical protein